MNRNIEPMEPASKQALQARGQMCRPVGWSRHARRKSLRFRRRARALALAYGAASVPHWAVPSWYVDPSSRS